MAAAIQPWIARAFSPSHSMWIDIGAVVSAIKPQMSQAVRWGRRNASSHAARARARSGGQSAFSTARVSMVAHARKTKQSRLSSTSSAIR
jgi:hypothetical protein